jgi:hypothetical protein
MYKSSVAMTIVDLCDSWDIPYEITDKILRQVFKIPHPIVNCHGNIVAKVKNVWRSPTEYVLESVGRLESRRQIANIPGHVYSRQVCIWKPGYYDVPIIQKGIEILRSWVTFEWQLDLRPNYISGKVLEIKPCIDRKSAGWIGFRTWMQTHPVYSEFSNFHYIMMGGDSYFRHPMGDMKKNRSYSRLTSHWFKYELAKAYPTLYGKDGWANKLEKGPEQY